MKKVFIMATGGTIASEKNRAGSAVAKVPVHDLLDGVALPEGVAAEAEQVFQLNSFNLALPEMTVLANRAREILAEAEIHGVVVTHGTDTMEETSFFLSLFLDPEKPVVFTGAQRTAGQAGADGARNLQDAIAVASDENSRGIGVVIVFDGEIWAAPCTRKVRTLATAAFDSQLGPIGTIASGLVTILRRPIAHPICALAAFRADGVRVDVVPCYAGVDTVALDAVIKAGARGLVIEGMGAGDTGRALVEALTLLLERGMPVILTTRVATGLAAGIYGDGGGADLVGAGAILGGLYRAPQLRILMLVALGASESARAAQTFLTSFLSPPPPPPQTQ